MLEFIFGVLVGTALVIYGVDLMSEGLERAAGPSLQGILQSLTGKLWSAFLVGTFVTAAIQSSTAVTLMTVNFVQAGLMTLRQSIGIIYGANIGTTITAQLMAFALTDLALPLLAAGLITRSLAKREWSKNLGVAMMGLGLLFLGLKTLSGGVPFIEQSPAARQMFTVLSGNPVTALVAGMITTILVQSSSATVGLTIILAQSGIIDLRAAIALTLGDNIGTCATAQMASIHGSVAARRTAWAHTLYNVIGSLIALLMIAPFSGLMSLTSADLGRQVANTHTVFNLLSAVVFYPMTSCYVRLLEWWVPDRH
ncbi:MAG: Na/Pi cotransporter family protein [Bacillota bacterium]